MKELSLHILDIVQNSIHAGATEISIEIQENISINELIMKIEDNGKGMTQAQIVKSLDPFFTSKNKKTGLGIPLLKQHAELAGGSLNIVSEQDSGTTIKACFEHDNLDRQPMGNIMQTLINLIRSNPAINFCYSHKVEDKKFILDLKEIKNELDGIPINSPEIIKFIEQMVHENLVDIGAT